MRCQLRPLTPPPFDRSIRSCRFSHCFVSPAKKYSFRECDFPSLGVPEWTWAEWTWAERWAECWVLSAECLTVFAAEIPEWKHDECVSVTSSPRLLACPASCLCAHVCVHLECRRLLSALGCQLKKKKVSISIKKKNNKTFFEHIWMASRGFWWLLTVFMSVVLQSKMQNAYCSVNTVERVGVVWGWWGGGRISFKKKKIPSHPTARVILLIQYFSVLGVCCRLAWHFQSALNIL